MTEEKDAERRPDEAPFPTDGATTEHVLDLPSSKLAYRAIAEWITLRRIHKPVAHVFHSAYLAESPSGDQRPLTFVFNGGPGAASAYLHMGALGPRRVAFGSMGTLPHPPTRVVDNLETWLAFTDLVFIDPVGTGFSRALKETKKESQPNPDESAKPEPDPKENVEFWEIDRDLESLGEFICRFLSKHHRWTSPLFIAGESYGGFRAAKMARRLQENHGVGLCGTILISPAIEFESLMRSDYDLTHWIELLPSLAAAAHHHGRTRNLPAGAALGDVLQTAESFANNEFARWLTQGDSIEQDHREQTVADMSALTGLPASVIELAGGRITNSLFCRELLRDERRLCGHYDAAITTVDPFPDRNSYEGPDPTLFSIDRLFTGAINHQLRNTLKVETELDYRLLSMQVHEAWKDKSREHIFASRAGAMDDLRYGMSLNEHMKVFIAHGHFDLVTPYYSTKRLVNLMKLTDGQKENLLTQNYNGGHMFYSWDESRTAFRARAEAFYRSAITQPDGDKETR
ncbi:MAG: hypothetical protein VB876_04615 [Pirellulales bacterium]